MIKLINLIKNIFRTSKPRGEKNYSSGKTWDELQIDLGSFKYSSDGFTLTYVDFTLTLNWCDITEINVYKRDLMTIDEICMQIVYGDKQIEISEKLPGWYQFVTRTKIIFPTIPKDWDLEVMQPPFATNYKTIYTKTDSSRAT